jgi:protein-tyrosine phosphatase
MLKGWLLRRRLLKRLPPPEAVRTVLVMCTANRVRSPFAEAMLRRELPSRVTVLSRGILEGGGRCPGEAVEAARHFDVDLSAHRARQVTAGDLLHADLVLTMELRMAHDLAVKYPALVHKVAVLTIFQRQWGGVRDIDDPYMLPPAEYEYAYDTIAACCQALAVRFAPPSPSRPGQE